MVKFSIIVLNFNGRTVLGKCLDFLEKLHFDDKEIIVLDGGSTDSSEELVIKNYPFAQLVDLGANLGYAKANNLGACKAKGEWVVFLNNDAYLKKSWLLEVEQVINKDPKVAAIGGKIYKWPTKEFDSAGAFIDYPLGYGPGRGRGRIDTGCWDDYCEVAYLSGAALCVNRRVFLEAGGFDTSYGYLHEETDLCWRLRLMGYKVVYSPSAICWHVGSYTFKKGALNRSYLVELNRMKTNAKNYDASNFFNWLFNEFLYSFFLSVTFFTKEYRQLFLAHLKASANFLKALKFVMKERMRIQSVRKISDDRILVLHRRRSIANISHESFVRKH